MIFTPLGFSADGFSDACRIEFERRVDARGFFARALCSDEFAAHRLPTRWPQANISYNASSGTVRGLHFQREPSPEAKLVRCIRGAIFDVIVDVRAGSPHFGTWRAFELNAENRSMLFIPRGFAHGFQALEPDTELLYFHDTPFDAPCQGGVNALDPALGIPWPLDVLGLSERDASLPALADLEPLQP
jgi:dTDP-4-dehydrorhamnose 3,5-epimerase